MLERLAQRGLDFLGGHRVGLPRFTAFAGGALAGRHGRVAERLGQALPVFGAQGAPAVAHRVHHRAVERRSVALALQPIERPIETARELRHRLGELACQLRLFAPSRQERRGLLELARQALVTERTRLTRRRIERLACALAVRGLASRRGPLGSAGESARIPIAHRALHLVLTGERLGGRICGAQLVGRGWPSCCLERGPQGLDAVERLASLHPRGEPLVQLALVLGGRGELGPSILGRDLGQALDAAQGLVDLGGHPIGVRSLRAGALRHRHQARREEGGHRHGDAPRVAPDDPRAHRGRVDLLQRRLGCCQRVLDAGLLPRGDEGFLGVDAAIDEEDQIRLARKEPSGPPGPHQRRQEHHAEKRPPRHVGKRERDDERRRAEHGRPRGDLGQDRPQPERATHRPHERCDAGEDSLSVGTHGCWSVRAGTFTRRDSRGSHTTRVMIREEGSNPLLLFPPTRSIRRSRGEGSSSGCERHRCDGDPSPHSERGPRKRNGDRAFARSPSSTPARCLAQLRERGCGCASPTSHRRWPRGCRGSPRGPRLRAR